MGGMKQATGAALFGLLASGTARGETLDQAIASAATGPRMIVARATYRVTVASAAVAVASGRPTIVFDATATRNFDSDVYGPRLRDQSTLQVGIPLYAGGRIRAGRAGAHAQERAGRAALDAAEARLAVDVADVYTAVQEARELCAVTREAVQRLKGVRHRIDAERRAGVADATDMAQGSARLAAARRDLVDAERRLSVADERYAELVGHYPGDTLDYVAPALPFDADAAAEAVRRDNPELRSLRFSIEVATHDIAAQRSYGRPSLNLIGSGSYGNTGTGLIDNTFVLSGGASEQVGSPRRFPHRFTARGLLVLRIPFYQGGEAAARVARAEAGRAEAQARAMERERAVVAETRDAVWRANGAAAEERLAVAAVEAGRDALKGVDIGRSIGDRSELDVLNAARELADAQSRRARARREATMQAVVALSDTGRLDEALGRQATGTIDRSASVPRSTMPIRFDLALLPGSRSAGRLSPAGGPRPLRYDLTGLG